MDKSSPSEANSSSATREIPRILSEPKFLCHVHKGPPLVIVLSLLNPLALPVIWGPLYHLKTCHFVMVRRC